MASTAPHLLCGSVAAQFLLKLSAMRTAPLILGLLTLAATTTSLAGATHADRAAKRPLTRTDKRPLTRTDTAAQRLKTASNPDAILEPSRISAWRQAGVDATVETSHKRNGEGSSTTLSAWSRRADGTTYEKLQAASTSPAAEGTADVSATNTLTKRGPRGLYRQFTTTLARGDGAVTERREYHVAKPGTPYVFTFQADERGAKVLKVATRDGFGNDLIHFAIEVGAKGALQRVVNNFPKDSRLQGELAELLGDALATPSLAPYHDHIRSQLASIKAPTNAP